jgi:hypothetical protein
VSSRTDFLEAWIVVASGSTIVDPDQDGSRRAETAGIAADPIFGEVRAWIAAMSALLADMIA